MNVNKIPPHRYLEDTNYWPPPDKPECMGWEVEKIPQISGIYFIFEGLKIIYVGIAGNIRSRLRRHHVFNPEAHGLAFSPVNHTTQMLFCECYYIALLRPTRQFGTKSLFHSERHDFPQDR